jgi:MoxR-like ATPase
VSSVPVARLSPGVPSGLPSPVPSPGAEVVDPAHRATAVARALTGAVCGVVRGSEPTVRLAVCALLSGGHVLVEDLPGTGKTTMARAFAQAIGGSFGRIQATADLMPADITGSGIWEPGQGGFRFVPGPVFANVLVLDELNRTPPRTQSAFMEALDEGAVTVDGVRHLLPDPFFAIATQNPGEQYGTFPLPEGELDRFAVSVNQATLDLATELTVVREQLRGPTVQQLRPVVSVDELRQVRSLVRAVHVAEPVLSYAVALVRATRTDDRVTHGASSRAALSLVRTAQAHAALEGRHYVIPDDVKAVVVATLAHRLTFPRGAAAARPAGRSVVSDLVSRVPGPLDR